MSFHEDELRAARWQFRWRAVVFAVGAALWLILEPFRQRGPALLVGLAAAMSLASVIEAAMEWRRLSRVKPGDIDAATIEPAEKLRDAQITFAERVTAVSPRLTHALILGMCGIWILEFLVGGSGSSAMAAGLVRPLPRFREWWRLVTSSYLHASLAHLIGNMMALAAVGRIMEAYAPRSHVAIVYFCAAIAGALASLALMPPGVSVGASAGILGLLGYLLVLSRRRDDVPSSLQTSLVAALVFTTFIGLFGFWFIDNAGHAGGLVAGVLLGAFTIRRSSTAPAIESRLTQQLGWAAVGLVIAGAVFSAARIVQGAVQTRARLAAQNAKEGMTPIRNVLARVVSSTPAQATLVVENRGESPLDAWKIDVAANPRDARTAQSLLVDACCFRTFVDAQPIAPRDSRQFTFARPAGSPRFAASLRVVVFNDLSFGGSTLERDAILRRREAAAETAEYWIRAINEALKQGSNATALLGARVKGYVAQSGTAEERFRNEVVKLLDEPNRTPRQLTDDAKVLVDLLERRRAALLKHKR